MRKCEPQMPIFFPPVERTTYVCQLSKGRDSVKDIDSLENQWKKTWGKNTTTSQGTTEKPKDLEHL